MVRYEALGSNSYSGIRDNLDAAMLLRTADSFDTQTAQSLDRMLAATNASCLFISHDLAVVSQVCSRVAVMLRGRIVEEGPVDQVFSQPQHPYTAGLVGAGRLDVLEPGTPLPTVDDLAKGRP